MIEQKLETVLKRYVENEHQGSESPLCRVPLAEGHISEIQDDAERIVFDVGDRGGPHMEEGIYQVPVEMVIITDGAKKAENDAPIARHAERVEALAGIFVRDEQQTVIAALEALDGELGISAYSAQPHQFARGNGSFRTVLPFIFTVHLRAEGE